jgi:hypothetical protein
MKPSQKRRGGEPVPLDPAIVSAIATGSMRRLLMAPPRANLVKEVDFMQDSMSRQSHVGGGDYSFHFVDALFPAAEHPVACFLPCYGGDQVVSSADFWNVTVLESPLHRFNKTLNERFKASLEESDDLADLKLAICYGGHIFRLRSITGTVYVLWARYIQHTNMGNVASIAYDVTPVVLNLNGKGVLKAVFILKPEVRFDSELYRVAVTADRPELLLPRTPLFVCEERAERPAPPESGIQTLSRRAALARVLNQTHAATQAARREHNVWENSLNAEDDNDAGNDVVDTYKLMLVPDVPGAVTPTSAASEPETREPERSPRVVSAAGKGKDPFE